MNSQAVQLKLLQIGMFTQRDLLKFPKITMKSKSVPSNSKSTISSLDLITAKSWLYSTPQAEYSSNSNVKREIASLTKIMTALCTLQICDKFNMNIKSTYFKVTSWATSTSGTTADLIENTWMTVEDLLFGLLLPSGNDAATVLSQNIGAVLYFDKSGNQSMVQQIRSIDLTEDYESVKFYTHEFIVYMNAKCKSLKMMKTRFANPHGLDHINNYSTCEDVFAMSKEAMRKPILRKIVKAATHKANYKVFRQGKVVVKSIFWMNTNKLLQRNNIIGIKTGITSKAGGCLATSFTIDQSSEGFLIVLGSNSTQGRFRDTLAIMNWALEDH